MKYRFAYAILLTAFANLYGQEENSSQPKKSSKKENNTISLSRKDLCILFNIIIIHIKMNSIFLL